MKKILLLSLVLFGCTGKTVTDADIIQQMKKPVVVVAAGGSWWDGYSVILKDGNGKLSTLRGNVYSKINAGDTLIK